MGMLAIGVTAILYLIVTGFIWLIGMNLIAEYFEAAPLLDEDSQYYEVQRELRSTWESILLFVPGALFLFWVLKLIINAGRRGED